MGERGELHVRAVRGQGQGLREELFEEVWWWWWWEERWGWGAPFGSGNRDPLLEGHRGQALLGGVRERHAGLGLRAVKSEEKQGGGVGGCEPWRDRVEHEGGVAVEWVSIEVHEGGDSWGHVSDGVRSHVV